MNPARLIRSTIEAARTDGLGGAYAFVHERVAVHLIERPKGISTEGHIPQTGIGHNEVGLGHVPVTYRNLHIALRMARLTGTDTVLDYGSGLGRVLIEAARLYPIRRAIGVESSPELAAESRQNITRARPMCPIEIIEADAATFEIPGDVTVAFFVNPFHGPVLDAVLARVRPHMRLVAVAPEQGSRELLTQFRNCFRIERIARRKLIGNAGWWQCQVYTVKDKLPGRFSA